MKWYTSRRLVAIGLILTLIGGMLASTEGPALWDAAQETLASPEALRGFVSGYGAWAPAVFFVVQVAQVVIAPILGGAMVIVGTLMFGPWGGLALSLLGGVVGSALVFVAARRWGKPVVVRLIGEEVFDEYVGVFDAGDGGFFLSCSCPSFRAIPSAPWRVSRRCRYGDSSCWWL